MDDFLTKPIKFQVLIEKLSNFGFDLKREEAAGVAHEINNPLAIIAGSLSLLTRFKDNPEKFAAKVAAMQKATSRIEKIVKGLSITVPNTPSA